MYVPSYECLLRSLRTNKEVLETSNEITIPVALLNLLLQLAVARSDFDEDGYLGANPDVRQALQRGDVESGQMHYIWYGYFEGRTGGTVKIDERRYLGDDHDVAAAINEGVSSRWRITSTRSERAKAAVRARTRPPMRRSGKGRFAAGERTLAPASELTAC
jgi:hypothetical protein